MPDPLPPHADPVVVGAGVVRSATAWTATGRGLPTVFVGQFGLGHATAVRPTPASSPSIGRCPGLDDEPQVRSTCFSTAMFSDDLMLTLWGPLAPGFHPAG